MSARQIVSVLSATGTQGAAVTKALSAKGLYDVRAFTRNVDSEKAQKLANLPNVTLVNANKLTETLKESSVVYAYGVADSAEVEYMKNIADQAEKSGVDLFIYSGLPSISKESKGKYNDVLEFERKHEIENYIKCLKMKSIMIQLGAFTENLLNWGLVEKDGDKLAFKVNFANTDTELAMVNVDPDLGQAICLILENYKSNSSLFERPIPITSYRIPFGNHPEILKNITVKEVTSIISDTFSQGKDIELDQMREYFDNVGMYNGELPDPRLTAIGYKPHDFAYYVEKSIIPTLGL